MSVSSDPGSIAASFRMVRRARWIGRQGFVDPAGVVAGEHVLGPETLPERMSLEERVTFDNGSVVVAESDEGADAPLLQLNLQSLQPGHSRLGPRPLGHIAERRSAPQAERVISHREGTVGLLVDQALVDGGTEVLESGGADVLSRGRQSIGVALTVDE